MAEPPLRFSPTMRDARSAWFGYGRSMKDGPDIARTAALIGDPARANMLVALMSGKALTATELAAQAGVTVQTASSHLARLHEGGLLRLRKQGRHKYFSLASSEVAGVLEALMGLAAGAGHLRSRTGPSDKALRKARICYNHLAGDMGVQMFDALLARGHLDIRAGELRLTDLAEASPSRSASMLSACPPRARCSAGNVSTGASVARTWREVSGARFLHASPSSTGRGWTGPRALSISRRSACVTSARFSSCRSRPLSAQFDHNRSFPSAWAARMPGRRGRSR